MTKNCKTCDKNLSGGCKWKIKSVKYNNCFFNLREGNVDKYYEDKEIATLLSMTVEEIQKVEQSAIDKIRNNNSIKKILEHIEIFKK